MNLKHILILLTAVTTQVMSFPIVKSNEYCNVNNSHTTIKYCAIKPDSLKEGKVHLDISKLKNGNSSGIVTPEKEGLKHRFIRPENADPSMVIRPSADIEMR